MRGINRGRAVGSAYIAHCKKPKVEEEKHPEEEEESACTDKQQHEGVDEQ